MDGARRQRREVGRSLAEAAQKDEITIEAEAGLDSADLTIGRNYLTGQTHEGEEDRHIGHLIARGKGRADGSGDGVCGRGVHG